MYKWFPAFMQKWFSRHPAPLRYNKDFEKAISLYDQYIKGAIKLEVFTDFLQKNKEKLDVIIQERQTYTSFLFREVARDFYCPFNGPLDESEQERVSDCIQAMLIMGADPNQRVCIDWSETTEKNLRPAANCSFCLNAILHWLIANDRSDHAIDFINMKTGPDKKIDLNLCDELRKTPLLFIVGRKYFYGKHGEQFKDVDQKLIGELVKLGADINMADAHFNTPLHIACVKRDVDAVKALLSSSTLDFQSLKARNNLERKPTDMLGLSYAESYAIIYELYPNDIDDIIQERTVNSPEAERNAEQIRQLIRDKQNELEKPKKIGDILAESIRRDPNNKLYR